MRALHLNELFSASWKEQYSIVICILGITRCQPLTN